MKRRSSITVLAMCILSATVRASANDVNYPDPVRNPSSSLMLAGDWLPKDTSLVTKDWVEANLPTIPSQHSIVHDVRDANGTRINQHNYLAFYGGLYWVIWTDGPGQPNKEMLKWAPDHRTFQPYDGGVGVPGDTRLNLVRGATSVDGVNWSEPFDVAGEPATNHGWIARGLWVRDGKLLALASQFEPPEYTGPGLSLHAFELESAKAAAGTPPVWRKLGMICDDALNNFEPQKLPTGEWMMSRRNGKADVFVMIGGVAGLDKWTLIPMVAYEGEAGFRPEEPVSYTLPDQKTLVFLFRDNSKGGFLFRSFSTDNARTWTKPIRTNFPDATSKFYVLRLKDGRYVLVSNACRPGQYQRTRDPLMLSVSDDGLVYRQMGILAGGRQVDYPHAMEHDGHILVAFASAKQSIEVLKIKLEDLKVLQPVTAASYRRITVTDDGEGCVREITPVPEQGAPLWATRVSQAPRSDWQPSAAPLFATPIPFVIPPPPGSGEPFHRHNHCPSIAWLPNGDLLAVWFSAIREEGLEMTILASRLRAGSQAWDPASEFLKAAGRNMTGSSVFFDEHTGVLHHLNGMGPADTEGWARLVMLHRQSLDNGTTWTVARPVSPCARYQPRNQVSAGLVRTRDGSLLQCCDATGKGDGDSTVHVSRDDGQTWSETGGNIRGIHAGLVELADGTWLAFGRGRDIDGRMPRSISADQGKTWQHTAGPFPGIGPAQRLALLRLREGPLLLVSFTGHRDDAVGLDFTNADGATFRGRGMFAALSYDDGATWPVRRLVTPGNGSFAVGPYFGAKVSRPPVVTTTPTQAEREGYLAATQTPDGTIHVLSSRLHYRFNLPWLRREADVDANKGATR